MKKRLLPPEKRRAAKPRRALTPEERLANKRRLGNETYARIMADPTRREARAEYSKGLMRKLRWWLAEYKRERGCIDCGYNAHPAALQLDHNGPKTATISELRTSIQRMMTEIERGRCVVRCANCHAVKTWAEKNGRDYAAIREADKVAAELLAAFLSAVEKRRVS